MLGDRGGRARGRTAAVLIQSTAFKVLNLPLRLSSERESACDSDEKDER